MRLRKDAKLELLRRVPLFGQVSRRELERIAAIADEVDLPEGRELTREGERGREFFVVIDGTLDVRRGKRRVNRLQAGDFFGEIALLTNTPRTATVTATSPVRTLVIVDREFKRLLHESPSIAVKVLEALAERVSPNGL